MLAGGKDFNLENILFGHHTGELAVYTSFALNFEKDGHCFENFRIVYMLCMQANGMEMQRHIMVLCLCYKMGGTCCLLDWITLN